jgi:putative ABC transport system ATP-binding protein
MTDNDIDNEIDNDTRVEDRDEHEPAPTVIRIDGLSKVYSGTSAVLSGIDLTIGEGEWTSIIGPSGSGKTTLLNMIGCLDTPTDGKIAIGGIRVDSLGQSDLTRFRRENIGLIFQQYHLVPYLTALENVMMAQYFHSITDEGDAKEALERVGLGHRLDHIPAHLSGGEQQRVCIARALINEPRIILADEPTGNLDQENGRNVLSLIQELHEDGHTIIMVTHNPEIADMGDRTIKIIDGRIASDLT